MWRAGLDLGTRSVGFAAVEYDSDRPSAILGAMSLIHDSGVLEEKTATTRLAAAGIAKRTRRLIKRRRQRLVALDRHLRNLGWGEPPESTDPYAAWSARAELAERYETDDERRGQQLTLALRHIARHRGWRNPWSRASSLHAPSDPSEFFTQFKDRVEQATGHHFANETTVGQLAAAALAHDPTIALRARKKRDHRGSRTLEQFSYIGGKLMQSDLASEVRAIARTQRLDTELVRELIELVFAAESPRGSHAALVGRDPFDGRPRAPKASETFQRFRIAATLANVRVRTGSEARTLSVEERVRASEYLNGLRSAEAPNWSDVAKVLDLARGDLKGTASLDSNAEERLPARPPVNITEQIMGSTPKKLSTVANWWRVADRSERDALIAILVDSIHDDSDPASVAAWDLVTSLSEEELAALDNLDLPAGRGAYSVASLGRLTEAMLTTTNDLHGARKSVFGVSDDWVPPSDPIGAPIGNPAVDRVTKSVARWLAAATAEWGPPTHVVVEHVREAFVSESAARERERQMSRRYRENERTRMELKLGDKSGHRITNADLRRNDAIRRQKGQCGYCGETITFSTSEMDHIVPRSGVGSTNTRTNLVAVCRRCNNAKGKLPFATWAARSSFPDVSVEKAIERTRHWTRDPGLAAKSWAVFLSEVRDRLRRTDADPAIDGRSLESVAWMANELRERIAAEYSRMGTKISVYQGSITAGARGAAGIAGKLPLIGGGDKTRLDRRHHAVDAAVVTLLDESVARTLAERNNLRVTLDLDPFAGPDWRTYEGSAPAAVARFTTWKQNMDQLATLLTVALETDRIPVTQNLRLRLANGPIHEATIRPLIRRQVGSAMKLEVIDAASTPALWTALTRHPDFDPEIGLPESSNRRLRLQGRHLESADQVEFFDRPRAALAVRGGFAELGTIHHARIYRWEERGKPKYGMLRVFASDLVRRQKEDLFTVKPDGSWVSMRIAHPTIGRADLSKLDYLGWLVAGDELLLTDDSIFRGGEISQLAAAFGKVPRWKLTGFDDAARVTLRPLQLAEEGLDSYFKLPTTPESIRSIEPALRKLVGQRWRVSINVLATMGGVAVIRRDALGRPRLRSAAGLPTSWQLR